MEPREYQRNIFETAKNNNTLVILPTGMGKTLIALLLTKYHLSKNPKSKILFLAPTRPLTQQHFNYFKENLPELYAEMQLFTGKINATKRESLWKIADIVFSTPQCIANDLRKNKISLENVSLLIEDECHRCLKNYDYVFVAKKFSEQSNGKILGLTASPGSDPKIIQEICNNLKIEKVEIRNRFSEDVRPYIQELKTEIIKVDFPDSFKRIRSLLKDIYDKKIDELKNRQLLFGNATKTHLLELQSKLAKQVYSGNNHFNILRGLSVCAQAIKIDHALELLETQGISSLYKYIHSLFEQAKKQKSKAVSQIIKSQQFTSAYIELSKLLNNIEHPKLEKIEEIIKEEISKNPKARFIVFSQYRDTVVLITKRLNKIQGIKAKIFVGQTKKTIGKEETGLSQKEQNEIINQFKIGEINVLVATSIGEEGLDLPEVDCVVFYEPIPSAIRKIQRTGRTARLKPGKLIILITKMTRDEAYHYASISKERKMYGVLNNINRKFSKKIKQKNMNEFF
ncbi:MAG: DEAD/DEAH box helicase [Candidatus Pacearchaeota archaeon]